VTTNGGHVSRWALTRSRLAFVLGSGILFHEVVLREGGDRPYVLLAALSLCGVASFLKLDEILKGAGITIVRGRDKELAQKQNREEATPNGREPAP
jgi:hypothetical protein